MPETQLIRYRLEPDSHDRVEEWVETVQSRRDEAVETLRDENVFTESAFVERRPDGDYLAFYMEAEDVEAAFETFEASTHDIDVEFRQFLADVVADDQPDGEIEPLYHLTSPDRP